MSREPLLLHNLVRVLRVYFRFKNEALRGVKLRSVCGYLSVEVSHNPPSGVKKRSARETLGGYDV